MHWFTVWGKIIIFGGDKRKIKASIITLNFLTTGILLKVQFSLTHLTGIRI